MVRYRHTIIPVWNNLHKYAKNESNRVQTTQLITYVHCYDAYAGAIDYYQQWTRLVCGRVVSDSRFAGGSYRGFIIHKHLSTGA